MTEILTESFCERCGTRYTFESNAPRRSRVGRVRTLSKGLRNFVLSDDASLSEAMADARSEEELSATAHQLDAFHKTFNFCLTCRQYTCGTCWNPTEGRCLTCAPSPEGELGGDAMPLVQAGPDGHVHAEIDGAWPEADLERINAVLGQPQAPDGLEATGPAPGVSIPPASGTPAHDPAGVTGAEAAPAIEAIPSLEHVPAAGPAGAEDVAAAGEEPSASPAGEATDVQAEADWAAATAAARGTSGVDLIGVAPGQSLEDAIAAYESRLAEQELAEAEAASAANRATEPGGTPAAPANLPGEAAPISADDATRAADPAAASEAPSSEALDEAPADQVAAADERTAPEPPPSAAPTGAAAPRPAPTPTDVIAQPTWPVAPTARPTSDGVPAPASTPPAPPAPATPTTPPASAPAQDTPTPSPWLRVAPDSDAAPAPQWPAAPAWPTASGREMPTTLAGRPLLPRDDASALWAASAREVLGPAPAGGPVAPVPASPQPCVQCGLSLSANARFCRRCGSRQG